MSTIVPAVVFQLHVARSELIDAYNVADLAVRRKLRALGKVEKGMMGDNLIALEAVPANPQYAKTAKKAVDVLVAELREVQLVRVTVVHSCMTVVLVDKTPTALYSNVQKSTPFGKMGLLLTLSEMNDCANRMKQVARELDKPIATASAMTSSPAPNPIKTSDE